MTLRPIIAERTAANKELSKTGPEYLTVFEGATGKELSTVAYEPSRNILSDSAWGDSFGNRCERYLACVAYLDGKKAEPCDVQRLLYSRLPVRLGL